MSVPVWDCQQRRYIWKVIWVLYITSDICHFIWQVLGRYIWYLIWVLHLKMWTHILPLSLHLTSTRDVYLIPDLGTSSENVNSHLTFVTSSDKYQWCISDTWSRYFIWKCELTSYLCQFIWQVPGGISWPGIAFTISEILPQHFLKTHFCLESGFLSFLDLQKSLLVGFQGCWTQWWQFWRFQCPFLAFLKG